MKPSSTTERVIPADTVGGNGNGAHAASATGAHDVQSARTGKVVLVLCVLATVFVVLYFVGIIPHTRRVATIQRAAEFERNRLPVVSTAVVRRAAAEEDLALPGATSAIQEARIDARTSGYLKKRYVDIGDTVKAGQLLAEIDTPEVDQQLNQSRAELAQAKADVVKLQADLDLAKATLERYAEVGAGGAVSQQELDVRRAAVVTAQKTVEAGEAAVAAKEADVKRLENMQGFQKVVAPFDGRITARNVDSGALITAGGGGAGGDQLFRLADINTLRIFINVPQGSASSIRQGQDVRINLREDPKRPFAGKVTRTSGSIDPASRTMRVEVQVDNRENRLLPGMYVVAHFTIKRDMPPMIIPSDAVLPTARGGLQVAVLDEQNRVRFRKVETGRNYGDDIEILDGLREGETIIANLAGGLEEGAAVQIPQAPSEVKKN